MSSVMFARTSSDSQKLWNEADWKWHNYQHTHEVIPYWKDDDPDESLVNVQKNVWAIIVPVSVVFITIFVIVCIKIYLYDRCNSCCDEIRMNSPTPHGSWGRNAHRPGATNLHRTAQDRNSQLVTNGIAVSPSDRPPEYSTVVISDLNRKDNFPEVHSTPKLESPPPKYEEASLMKF